MKKMYTQPELTIRRLTLVEHVANASDNEVGVGPGGDIGTEQGFEIGGQIG